MDRFKWSFYITAGIICLILVVFALHVFPRPGTDSVVFIPTALLYSKGFGLTNPLYYVTQITDATHTNRFNYYVPFYSFFLGVLSQVKPGLKTIFFFCALFSTLNIFLYVRLISSALPQKLSLGIRIAVLLSLAYVATYLLPTTGRPENFTCLFVFLIYILYNNRDKVSGPARFVCAAILFSLMLATQLICFYFGFLFYALYNILNAENVFKSVLTSVLLFICVLALFCGILQLSPNGLVSTLNGIYIHINYVMGRSDRSLALFVHYWLLAPTNIGFLAVFLMALYFFVREMYLRLRGASTIKFIFAVSGLIAIAVGVVKFILYASPTIYNATEFILPLLVYITCNIVKAKDNGYKKGGITLLAVTYLSGALFFLWNVALFAAYTRSGKDYDAAKSTISRLTEKNKEICITNGLWSLFDRLDNVTIKPADFLPGDTLVVQEMYNPYPASVTDKYELLYDWRSGKPTVFMGITIAKTPHNYGFAVYKIK